MDFSPTDSWNLEAVEGRQIILQPPRCHLMLIGSFFNYLVETILGKEIVNFLSTIGTPRPGTRLTKKMGAYRTPSSISRREWDKLLKADEKLPPILPWQSRS